MTGPGQGDEPLAVRLDEARHDAKLAGEIGRRHEARAKRLEAEVQRLEVALRRLEEGLSATNAELESFRSRLVEREGYVRAIHTSSAWRLIQAVRGLLGRRWPER